MQFTIPGRFLASLCFATTSFAGTLALSPSGIADTTSSYTDTQGWSFTLSQTVSVTALDYYDPSGANLAFSHQVGVWTSTGTLLFSTTIPSGAPGVTNGSYESVAIAPYSLSPGNYVIGATSASYSDLYVYYATAEPTISGVSFTGGGYITYASGLNFPTPIGNNANPEFLSADFEVGTAQSNTPTPEPSTFVMLAGGMVFLWRRARG